MSVLYDVTNVPLLNATGSRFLALKSDAERVAQNEIAENLLGLSPPAYVGTDAKTLAYAVALQVAFQLEQGYSPQIEKSISRSHPGDVTTFRDRYVDARAMAIVASVTRAATVGFSPTPRGV